MVNPNSTPALEPFTQTLGGRILCRRCSARSKRTGKQCQGLAMKGKTKCRSKQEAGGLLDVLLVRAQ